MKQIELIDKRKPREKHFLNEDGTITANIYDHDVHFEKNGHYETIDTNIVSTDKSFINDSNTFKTEFDKNNIGLINISKDNYYLKIIPKNINALEQSLKDNIISYKDKINDIEYNYRVESSRLKETIIFNCKELIPEKISYYVDTNLSLEIVDNRINVKNNNETVFVLEAPYMEDATGTRNPNIGYELIKQDNIYELNLVYNQEWVKDKNRPFPITIDPTIINGTGENVYDTYIATNQPDHPMDNLETLTVSCSETRTSRALLKFILPELASNDYIVSAILSLTYSPEYLAIAKTDFVEIHEITIDWDETTATWNNMSNKYKDYIENYFVPNVYEYDENDEKVSGISQVDITRLVKRWYSGSPNNGLMLKLADESYSNGVKQYLFASKTYDYNNGTTLRPYLAITYTNKSGIEQMSDYTTLSYYHGQSLINNYTGNVTSIISLNKSNDASKGTYVSIVHNNRTGDLSKVESIANGWKLYYFEYLEPKQVDGNDYLEYFDSDGTIHYFIKLENIYKDEEGLNLEVKLEGSKYVLSDTSGNTKAFTKNGNRYYLTKINTIDDTIVEIVYENNKITKIIDSYGSAITLTYNSNQIIIKSNLGTSTITLSNNAITKIEDKNGLLNITYNKNLITKIQDSNSSSLKIDYYDLSGKVKRVTSYGLNNEEGKSLTFNYKNNVTDITSGKHINSLTFNEQGYLISNVMYKNENKYLYEASGYSAKYANNPSNINLTVPSEVNKSISYVNNLLNDDSPSIWDGQECTDVLCVDPKSYKSNNGGLSLLYKVQLPAVEFPIDYTLSFAIKNNKKVTVVPYITNKPDNWPSDEHEILPNENFKRCSVPLYASSGGTLHIHLIAEDGGEIYVTDVQLEEGNVANTYNLVSNSDFSKGLDGWSVGGNRSNGSPLSIDEICTIENINDKEKALTIHSGMDKSMGVSRFFNYSGKRGDVYNLSFWYKHTGLAENQYGFNGNSATLQFVNNNSEDDTINAGHGTVNIHLTKTSDEWQFFNMSFVAENDYDMFGLNFISQFEVNTLSITNIMLVKSLGSYAFEYDDNGNIKRETDVYGNDITYMYNDKNSLVSMHSPTNMKYFYEKDNENEDRMIAAYTASGLGTSVEYDEHGKPVKTRIQNVTEINLKDTSYYIRAKGTKKYLSIDFNTNSLIFKENVCNNHLFSVVKEGDNYRLSFNGKNLFVNKVNNEYNLMLSSKRYTLFDIRKAANGSHNIGYYDNPVMLYITKEDNMLTLKELKDKGYSQEFYFEKTNARLYIESSTEYSEDGRYITKAIDINGRSTLYDTDLLTGNLKSKTDGNGNTTYYTYNDKGQLITTKYNGKIIYQNYNDKNLLSEVYNDNDKFTFEYDNFLRIKETKINGNTLVNYLYYPNDGKLKKITYASGSEVLYSYDELGRIYTFTCDGVEYIHYYDNFGHLAKIISDKDSYEYTYDYNDRLKEVKNDDLIIIYDYDLNDNVTSIIYNIKDKKYVTRAEIDENGYPTKYYINDIEIENIYDELGRPIIKKINGCAIESVDYVKKGNATSYSVNKSRIGNDIFYFEYDNNYNVILQKINGITTNEYEYDSNNQLILEKNYINDVKIKYEYDNNGNIVERNYFTLGDIYVKKDLFKYESEVWHDELTAFNDNSYTYDSMGNLVNTLYETFEWADDSRLMAYTNSDNNTVISYEYDINGRIRIKKVNNTNTKYYYIDNLLISEVNNNRSVYYLRDCDGLIGFECDDISYYYKKNIFGDIIGIYNSSFELIVQYEYDSWGNLINVVDINGNVIQYDRNHIAFINPYRYRGYYYDEDLKLYILSERLYNPIIGRFISSDNIICSNILGTNLFQYCNNNPLSKVDTEGNWWELLIPIGLGFVKGGIKVINNILDDKPMFQGFWPSVASGTLDSAIYMFPGALGFLAPVSPFVESTLNEASKYNKTTAKINKVEYQDKTFYNGINSVGTVLKEGATNIIIGSEASTTYPTGRGRKFSTLKGLFKSNSGKTYWKRFVTSEISSRRYSNLYDADLFLGMAPSNLGDDVCYQPEKLNICYKPVDVYVIPHTVHNY